MSKIKVVTAAELMAMRFDDSGAVIHEGCLECIFCGIENCCQECDGCAACEP